MKLIFEQTEDDIIELTTQSLRSSKIIKYVGLGLLIFVLINAGSILMNDGVGASALFNWLYPIGLVIILWYFLFKVFMKRKLNHPSNKNLMVGKRTVELLAEEIIIETSLSKSEINWSAISKFHESKNLYILYIGKSQGLIFPKRAFKSDQEVNDFKEMVNSKIK